MAVYKDTGPQQRRRRCFFYFSLTSIWFIPLGRLLARGYRCDLYASLGLAQTPYDLDVPPFSS